MRLLAVAPDSCPVQLGVGKQKSSPTRTITGSIADEEDCPGRGPGEPCALGCTGGLCRQHQHQYLNQHLDQHFDQYEFDPRSSNSSSNSSSNQSGSHGWVDDYQRDERVDQRSDGRHRRYRREAYEEYLTEGGGWRGVWRERGWAEDNDDD